MNANLEKFARQYVKTHLANMPIEWQIKFKLMYGRKNGKRSVEDTLEVSIDETVDKMESEKLDWAMTQIDNSILKLQKVNL